MDRTLERLGLPAWTWAAALLGTTSCTGEVEAAKPGAPAPLSFRAEQGPEGRRLVSWAFDGRAAVPSTSLAPSVEIEWGAAGSSPSTRLYLPLDEGVGERVSASRASVATEIEGCAWTDGRFGAGLELASPSARVTVRAGGTEPGGAEPDVAELFGSPWSLQLWVRPAAGRGGLLASSSGVMELEVLPDLRCRLVVALSEPFVLESQASLQANAWNRVAVVHDGPDLEQVRLVVNDRTFGAMRPAGQSAGGARMLVLGSGGPERPGLVGTIDDVLLAGRAPSSAECIEAYQAVAPFGERELELRYEDGAKVVRLWSGVLAEPALRASEEWKSGELHHFLADGAGLRWVPGDWTRDWPIDPPLPRTTHPTVFLGKHQALVFGGETRDSHLAPMVNTSDTWIYHIDEPRWEEVRSARAPGPRCHQPAAYSPDHDVVFYFGGWRNDHRYEPTPDAIDIPLGQVYRDTWLFDCARREWRQLATHDSPVKSDTTIVYHPPSRRFVVYSGLHIWTFDPSSERWESLKKARVVAAPGAAAAPAKGGSTIGGYDPATGLIFLFGTEQGGQPDGNNVYGNPTMVYDVAAHVITIRSPEPAPSGRVRAGTAYDPRIGEFVLFGGVQGQFSERKSDLWTYHVGKDVWTQHEASNTPSARGGYYGMAFDPELEVFVLPFGRHSGDRFLNETWRLRLEFAAEARATYVFDRARFPELDRVHVDWSGPSGSSLEVEAELSDDGLSWVALRPDDPRSATAARFAKVTLRGRPDEHGSGPAIHALAFAADDGLEAPEGTRRITLPLPALSTD